MELFDENTSMNFTDGKLSAVQFGDTVYYTSYGKHIAQFNVRAGAFFINEKMLRYSKRVDSHIKKVCRIVLGDDEDMDKILTKTHFEKNNIKVIITE